MKKILISTWLLLSLFSQVASAEDEVSAEALLHKMSEASKTLNYELSYILVKKNVMEPLLYRHAVENNRNLAHLVYLSGPMREIILRGEEASYFEPGLDPFSIRSGKMVGPLIPLLNSDIGQLSHFYDFVKIGRSREAGAACQIVRVVPKDGQRYSYIVWIDERSNLPLRADLVKRNGDLIEQYRTISYAVSDRIADILDSLNKAKLPDVLTLPKPKEIQADWQVTWVPKGFEPNNLNRYRMSATGNVVESQLYTDGLFNFSIYVSEEKSSINTGLIYRQGGRTLQTFIKNGREVSVIGEIPEETAKRIADSITFDNKVVQP